MTDQNETSPTALSGVRVLDLTRILAGPFCTQMLGDLGADIVKIERPGAGDDTRHWGPNYIKDPDGNDTGESAYFVSANRNKRSVAIDLAQPEGAAVIRQLAVQCDVVVENFKVGGLAKYGLSYDDLKAENPGLIYCSITGFGQTGPYADRAGYDFLIQGMGGLMSLGGEPDGAPQKTGVAISDVMCGMYAATAILAALRHRDQTGQGQFVDLSLFDTQVGWLVNQGMNYLTTGAVPQRLGNAHPNIVPYQAFAAVDGYLILAVGNDAQFEKFCTFAGLNHLSADEGFATNNARLKNRARLIPEIEAVLAQKPVAYWLDGLAPLGVPCGPVNDLGQVFDDAQLNHREMVVDLPHAADPRVNVRQIANPLKLSETPVSYSRSAPALGQHTEEVLREMLALSDDEIARLKKAGVI
ncbi:CaiB/BaiF CoA-transferase family protein [Magnetovibrio sp. PR-2]|uniref:CaiB/BaiF CoA transferase family protein n=1 Tax=Magnetovibrio sp. PR-2 TaxID=3120356 RepID=UPI002FCE6519